MTRLRDLLNVDRAARAVVAVGIVLGVSGIGWGYWESHEADDRSTQALHDQAKITKLLKEHARDTRDEESEQAEITAVVHYLGLSLNALCTAEHASCPAVPRLGD